MGKISRFNFFRIHLLIFTFVPLLFSGIFYAFNGTASGNANLEATGRSRVEYIDCLFLCFSAMTVTGLVTVNLSSLHPVQQAMLFLLFIFGDYSFVSLVVVIARKRFFRRHCSRLLADDLRIHTIASNGAISGPVPRPGLHGQLISLPTEPRLFADTTPDRTLANSPESYHRELTPEPIGPNPCLMEPRRATNGYAMRQRTRVLTKQDTGGRVPEPPGKPLPLPRAAHHKGLGGFPGMMSAITIILPNGTREVIGQRLSRPNRQQELLVHDGDWSDTVRSRIAQWLPETLTSLVIGRNGRFFTEELEDEDLVKIGGVEYRALIVLTWFVTCYILLFQAVTFGVLAVYFGAVDTWDSAFAINQGSQANAVDKTWFSLFSAVSGYTGTGMSLVDQSVIPFASTYVYIYMLNLVMLAGNHALPMTLRFCIWIGSKVTRGETKRTMHFLLDHPRRCFLYLFPSHQTWYLVLVLVIFTVIEMMSFIALNLDLPVLEDLGSGWQKFSDSLLQSLSVRAAGFGVVNISAMAPAVLFLYIIFMYVAIYPIAMSVRATNVYEEQSLGIYEADEEDEENMTFKGEKREIFRHVSLKRQLTSSKYLMFHMRKQLSFDVWPLALAIFLIACFERGKLLDEAKSSWFTIFRIIFECTSAYSTIGLSMGVPYNNYSFSGALGTASKLVMIGVMLRGRHRGLPVAIDRAIMLPREYARLDKKEKPEGVR